MGYGSDTYKREAAAIADALGLESVTPTTREVVNSTTVLARLSKVDKDALALQLEQLKTLAKKPDSSERLLEVNMLVNRVDVLRSHAGLIIAGLEQAVALTDQKTERANWNANDLIRLVWHMPNDVFLNYRSRLISLYLNTNEDHWLWKSPLLIRKLGYLGQPARFILTNPRLWEKESKAGNAPIIAACINGEAGRSDFEPFLLKLWLSPETNRLIRPDIFVALRRIGISPPKYEEDKFGLHDQLSSEWAYVTPQSPSRVCMVHSERQARKHKRSQSKGKTLSRD